jgi:hypothetical protein
MRPDRLQVTIAFHSAAGVVQQRFGNLKTELGRGSRKRQHIDSMANVRVVADPVVHSLVDSIRSNLGDNVCPIAVVAAGGERGASAPVGRVPEVGAKAPYPPGRSPALVPHVEAVVGQARRAVLCSASNGRRLAKEAIL